jgi:hypothetical protein
MAKKKKEDKSAVSMSNPKISHAIGKKLRDSSYDAENNVLKFIFDDVIVSVGIKANDLEVLTKRR